MYSGNRAWTGGNPVADELILGPTGEDKPWA